MCDERIFYLLNRLKSSHSRRLEIQEECVVDENYIRKACENLTELLCKSPNEKLTNRSQYIEFLCNYCKSCDGHLKVDETNFEVFLERLEISREQDDCDLKDDLETFHLDEPKNCFIQDLNDFFSKRLEKYKSKQLRLGLINDYNKRSFKDSFNFIASKKLENHSKNAQVIKTFRIEETISDGDNSAGFNSQKRESQIKLGYSVLNLNSIHKDVIVTNILSELETYQELKSCESKFVKFCLEKALFLEQNDRCKELLGRFKFLIEFCVIDLIDFVITNDVNDLENCECFNFIKNIIALDRKYKLIILDIMYELYSLSNYCDKVLNVIEVIKR